MSAILGFIPLLGTILRVIVGLSAFIAWLIGMIKAYRGKLYKFPIIGEMAEKLIKK